jgi:hypothetical protein
VLVRTLWTIVFYLNHYDIMAALREAGLLPAATG